MLDIGTLDEGAFLRYDCSVLAYKCIIIIRVIVGCWSDPEI